MFRLHLHSWHSLKHVRFSKTLQLVVAGPLDTPWSQIHRHPRVSSSGGCAWGSACGAQGAAAYVTILVCCGASKGALAAGTPAPALWSSVKSVSGQRLSQGLYTWHDEGRQPCAGWQVGAGGCAGDQHPTCLSRACQSSLVKNRESLRLTLTCTSRGNCSCHRLVRGGLQVKWLHRRECRQHALLRPCGWSLRRHHGSRHWFGVRRLVCPQPLVQCLVIINHAAVKTSHVTRTDISGSEKPLGRRASTVFLQVGAPVPAMQLALQPLQLCALAPLFGCSPPAAAQAPARLPAWLATAARRIR